MNERLTAAVSVRGIRKNRLSSGPGDPFESHGSVDPRDMKLLVTTTAGDAGTLIAPNLVRSSEGSVNGLELEMGLYEPMGLFDLVRTVVCWTILGLWCMQWVVHIVSILYG